MEKDERRDGEGKGGPTKKGEAGTTMRLTLRAAAAQDDRLGAAARRGPRQARGEERQPERAKQDVSAARLGAVIALADSLPAGSVSVADERRAAPRRHD